MIDPTPPTRRPGERRPVPPYSDATAAWVERCAADMTEAGMPRMASRVFACLLASQEGTLSSAELADRLQVSPAAVSGAVRYLAQMHLLSREREPGSRRERYRLQHDVWHEAIASRDPLLARWVATMESGVDAVGRDTEAGVRLAETADFLAFLRMELPETLARWRAQRGAG
ncbi:GbsR/MarR family transcriptional regulator [Streptomyces sp. SBT349]|uniref:GbsR/MarR family transcriptional regulator n=1 Tax=Streptomyces sp. SBT349 TaxID=1580539 RepID=UPI00099DB461|nr:MarR family transcriptional regulator [Streptomyces sp. SBT349]